jgi:hypothetical protein
LYFTFYVFFTRPICWIRSELLSQDNGERQISFHKGKSIRDFLDKEASLLANQINLDKVKASPALQQQEDNRNLDKAASRISQMHLAKETTCQDRACQVHHNLDKECSLALECKVNHHHHQRKASFRALERTDNHNSDKEAFQVSQTHLGKITILRDLERSDNHNNPVKEPLALFNCRLYNRSSLAPEWSVNHSPYKESFRDRERQINHNPYKESFRDRERQINHNLDKESSLAPEWSVNHNPDKESFRDRERQINHNLDKESSLAPEWSVNHNPDKESFRDRERQINHNPDKESFRALE